MLVGKIMCGQKTSYFTWLHSAIPNTGRKIFQRVLVWLKTNTVLYKQTKL